MDKEKLEQDLEEASKALEIAIKDVEDAKFKRDEYSYTKRISPAP